MRGRESWLAYTLLQPAPGVGVLLSAKQNCMDASFGAKDIRYGCCLVLTLSPLIWPRGSTLLSSQPLSLASLYCSLLLPLPSVKDLGSQL